VDKLLCKVVGLASHRADLSGNPQLLSNPLQLQTLDIPALIVYLVAALLSYQSVTSD
jgi:hypothetical protein